MKKKKHKTKQNKKTSVESFPQSVNEWYDYIGVAKGGNEFSYHELGYYSFLYKNTTTLPNSTSNGDYKAVINSINDAALFIFDGLDLMIPSKNDIKDQTEDPNVKIYSYGNENMLLKFITNVNNIGIIGSTTNKTLIDVHESNSKTINSVQFNV